MPRAARRAFASSTVWSPKWKMLAASTASARPSRTPSARWSRVPTPPEAMTGIPTASETARVRARSKPSRGPVPIHAGEQDLARPEGFHPRAPLDRVEAGRASAAVGVDLPSRLLPPPRIDRHHDALGADLARRIGDEAGIGDRRGIDGDLVRARVEEPADVPELADAAPHGERDEDFARHRLDHVDQGVALVGRGGDVEEGELVRALLVVAPRDLDRVTGIHDVDEPDAFHHPPGVHVETRDDPCGEPHRPNPPGYPSRPGAGIRRAIRRDAGSARRRSWSCALARSGRIAISRSRVEG